MLIVITAKTKTKTNDSNSLIVYDHGLYYVEIVIPNYDSCMIDGVVKRYVMCSKTDSTEKSSYEYIGKGTMYSYDGVRSHDKSEYYFFSYK